MAEELVSSEALELAALEELIAEIKKRCNSMMLIYELDHKTDPNLSYTGFAYQGSPAQALGLLEYGRVKARENVLFVEE